MLPDTWPPMVMRQVSSPVGGRAGERIAASGLLDPEACPSRAFDEMLDGHSGNLPPVGRPGAMRTRRLDYSEPRGPEIALGVADRARSVDLGVDPKAHVG
jgi:hypothetical protein